MGTAMTEFTGVDWILMSLCAFIAGLSKSGVPGLGILMVSIMAMVMPTVQSTGVVLPLLILSDILPSILYRRHASWTHLKRLLPSACVGVCLGVPLLRHAADWDDVQVRRILGAFVLFLLVLHLWNSRRKDLAPSIQPSSWVAWIVGALAGVVTMVSNAAGPIVSIYLMAMRLPKSEFMGTAALYFLLINCFKVPFSAGLKLITTNTLALNLMLAPFVLAGGVTGVFVLKRMSPRLFAHVVLAMVAAAGLKLLLGR